MCFPFCDAGTRQSRGEVAQGGTYRDHGLVVSGILRKVIVALGFRHGSAKMQRLRLCDLQLHRWLMLMEVVQLCARCSELAFCRRSWSNGDAPQGWLVPEKL